MKPNLQSHFKFRLIVVVLVLAVSAGGLIPKSTYAAPGDLYVSDPADSAIYVFTPDGTKSTFATIAPSLTETNFLIGTDLLGVAFDSGSNLYVSDAADAGTTPSSGRIIKITPTGTQSDFASGLTYPVGPAFDSAGNLFVATHTVDESVNSQGTILKFTPAGVQSTFKSGLIAPRGVVFDGAGNLYVSDDGGDTAGSGTIFTFSGELSKFTPAGTRSIIATGLAFPIGLALDGASNAFVAENFTDTGFGDILKFTSDGTHSTFASGLNSPVWLAFPPNTLPSSNPVPVEIGTVGSATDITLTYPQVTAGGTTMVTSMDPSSVGTPPPGFELTGSNLAFEITTTATYTTPIIIAFQVLSVDAAAFSQLQVWHNEGGELKNVTASNPPPDPITQTIYASVSSLSPFVIAKETLKAKVQQPINPDGSSVFSVKRGVVPVTFTLTSNGVATCQLPPAKISLIRTAGTVVGSIDESTYLLKADKGSNFRISTCQYVYNLATTSLGTGTYKVNILIGGTVVGSGTFGLK